MIVMENSAERLDKQGSQMLCLIGTANFKSVAQDYSCPVRINMLCLKLTEMMK